MKEYNSSNTSNWLGVTSSYESITTVSVDQSCQDYDGETLKCLFSRCSNLTTINNLNYLNTSKVKDMGDMFSLCAKLGTLNLSGFNTSNVTKMDNMFDGCSSLISIRLLSFDTSNVTTMSSMFNGCSTLASLDLSTFDTGKVTTMYQMFNGCTNLKRILVGDRWSTSSLTTAANNMFNNCSAIVGEYGTTYDFQTVNKTKAHTGKDGYLTLKTVTITPASAEGKYWATYYHSSVNRQADGATTVYAATRNGRTLTLQGVGTGGIINAGQGVILQSTAETITLTYSTSATAESIYRNNVLTGVDEATSQADGTTYYVLSNEGGTLGFYKYTADRELGAHKAFIAVATSGSAPAMLALGLDNGAGTTAISGTELKPDDEASDAAYYTLDGRRLTAHPAQKGIYITGGKKVVIK